MTKNTTLNQTNRRLCTLIITILFTCTQTTYAQCWNEVFSDEFTGSELDLSKWSYDIGTGCPNLCYWGNNERQYYTDEEENVKVENGVLKITAKYDDDISNDPNVKFTSGKIHTRGKFFLTYGRFEARMKLPQGRGLWPAFWMLPENSPYGGWPTGGEIDIMEYRGDRISRVEGTLHYGANFPNNLYDGTHYDLTTGDFVNDFHVFAVEWGPGEIRWYVDDVLYKTETQDPYTLNPPSNHEVQWPWDNDFYMIINLAVGGWFTGTTDPYYIINGDYNYTRTMEIDYVKVYEDISGGGFTGNISGNTTVLQNEEGLTFSTPHDENATYHWTVTGGEITNGNNTNSIEVTWGEADGTVAVTKTLDCGVSNYDLDINVRPTHCGKILDDFDNIRHHDFGYIHGTFTQRVHNPNPNSVNPSTYSARYTRNPAEQYDVLIYENVDLGNADDFKSRVKHLMMDVYSNAANRNIEITLESSAHAQPDNFPTGRHSTYRATTSVANSWETLQFNLVGTPHGALSGESVDRIVILFSPNTYTSHTFYFDNLMATHKPVVKTISGQETVCEDGGAIQYNIPHTSGSSYAWSVPEGTNILSGASGPNNNILSVEFGESSGEISVIETNIAGCTGDANKLGITVQECVETNINNQLNKMRFYPNPSSDIIKAEHIDFSGNVEFTITDQMGRVIKKENVTLHNYILEVDIRSLSPGIYVLSLMKDSKYYIGNFSKF